MEEALGSPPGDFERPHPASPWRFKLVESVQQLTADPDGALPRWLENGCPMGIALPVQGSGLFRKIVSEAELFPGELCGVEAWQKNHPSSTTTRTKVRQAKRFCDSA